MPQLAADEAHDWQKYYVEYVRTYIERDVHEVSDDGEILRFMISVAARTVSLQNFA